MHLTLVIFDIQKIVDHKKQYMCVKFCFKLGKAVIEIYYINVFGIQKWNDLRF